MKESPMKEEQFGLGELPDDATNHFVLGEPFTREDFKEALDKVFPFSQIPLDEQESSET